MPLSESPLLERGTFAMGCNYWASHAGTDMWVDWRPDVVDADLRRLADAGLRLIRVFPNWRDFQPLTVLRQGGGMPVEFRFGETPLSDTEAGRAGVSEDALRHFGEFLDLGEKHGMKMIVALVTGFMSGRLFAPPAFEGVNCHTDPGALRWQTRFVRCLVRRFKQHKTVAAWELGNECNNIGLAPSADAAYMWTAAIADAIRSEDGSRPIGSGMHALGIDNNWRLRDQAELTDFLTTHPYPYFTPYADFDPLNTFRACVHASAQTRYYADLGKRPVLAEELGQLGPCFSNAGIAADFARTTVLSLWAHDGHCALWWCANEQSELPHPPYDWCQMEQELGLFDLDGSPKPVLETFSEIGRFIGDLPFGKLPERLTDAVCILSRGQDHWAVAFGCFALSKQAGCDISYQYMDEELRDSPLYLLPCVAGTKPLSRRAWLALLEKVKAGATLYLSLHDGFLTKFEEVTGVEIQTRARSNGAMDMVAHGLPGEPELAIRDSQATCEFAMKTTRATVLAADRRGNPVFTCAPYGKGRVFLLAHPLETMLIHTPGVLLDESAPPFWKIYQHMARDLAVRRVLGKTSPHVGVTEHPLEDGQRVAVVINYSPAAKNENLTIRRGWRLVKTLRGDAPVASGGEALLALPANDAAVMLFSSPTPETGD